MNTYNTVCEAPGCRRAFLQQAASEEDAVREIRRQGWFIVFRDARGYESYCEEHYPFPREEK